MTIMIHDCDGLVSDGVVKKAVESGTGGKTVACNERLITNIIKELNVAVEP